jgi:desulfoferrodoxin (superoxide reductase-like protein)
MRKIACFFVFWFLITACSAAYAHPPSDITITYDPQTKILRAVIMHNTSNPESHYINKVDIVLNGKEIIEHEISRQDNNTSQAVSYLIPDAKTGDKLSLEAYCSISGELRKEIEVKE